MELPQIFRCLVGKHAHSTRMSKDEHGVVRSKCKGCGRRLVRVEKGPKRYWKLERKPREP